MADARTGQLKLALVGCGARGLGVYAPALARYANEHPEQVELTAACDIVEDRAELASREFGFVAPVDDIAAMIRDHKPDACLCVLPAFDTMMQGSQLLVQNMPCLLELPLGDSVDEIMEMSEAAREMNTPNMVALNRRFNPYLIRADRWARQLGDIRSITCSLATPTEADAAYLADTVAHAVDTLAHLLGRLGSHTLSTQGDATIITLPFDNDVTGTVAICSGTEARGEVYEIAGDGFRAVATVEDAAGPSLRCWRGQTLEVNIAGTANQPEAAADGTYDMLCAFIDQLAEGKSPTPSIDDAMPAVDLTFQIATELLQTADA